MIAQVVIKIGVVSDQARGWEQIGAHGSAADFFSGASTISVRIAQHAMG